MSNAKPTPVILDAPWDQTFHDLMPNRVREVLLVSSPYDAFILEEDGRLSDRIFSEYSELNLSNAPRITHAPSGASAMEMLNDRHFDLVLTMSRIPDTDVSAFGRRVKEGFPKMRVVLLVLTEADLGQFPGGLDPAAIDHVFRWTGDASIMLAIIKLVEDSLNIAHDMETGVRSLIVVEDSVRYYSSFLSLLYVELMKQSESLVAEGLNDLHRLLRMRARPKVLLARTYEEAVQLYDKYGSSVIALVSDVRFPHRGEEDPNAGYELVREVRQRDPSLAVLLQSAEPRSADRARELGTAHADKKSPNLLRDLRRFVSEALGFGDFIFRTPDGSEIARARHAFELEQMLRTVPAASIEYHASRNHFSHWLTARCMFSIAKKLRQWQMRDFGGTEAVRTFLIESLEEARRASAEGVITDEASAPSTRHGLVAQFVRVGKGSIGGKARGLAFLSSLVARHQLAERFAGLDIRIPNSAVVATEEFDRFFEQHGILAGGRDSLSHAAVLERCMTARFSGELRQKLRRAVAAFEGPLAVRSSSMLEDSQLQPFAGIYATYMLPNNHPDPDERFGQLCRAVKAVWASTYSEEARGYIARTPYSIEEEKMAVLIQQVAGQTYGQRFYPHIAGVALSYNYYPIGPQKAEDGVAMIALGLGQTIVQGGTGISFSPSDPTVLPQFASTGDYLRHTQRTFAALDLTQIDVDFRAREGATRLYELGDAETDGTLALAGSVYSPDDDALRDDLMSRGPRVVTFHNVLKWDALPLAPALAELLRLVREGMGCAVEIEFALDAGDWGRTVKSGREPTLYVLQVRPQATPSLEGLVDVEGISPEQMLCRTNRSLGHGIVEGIRDVVFVKRSNLQATETPAVANQIGEINRKLVAEKRGYLLVGPGRWGSSDPRLGIPVKWSQIAGAKVIIETAFEDRVVEPSQGAHFFHNVTSFRIGYLTLASPDRILPDERALDEAWLAKQRVESETSEVTHVRLDVPLRVLLDGRKSRGAIIKA